MTNNAEERAREILAEEAEAADFEGWAEMIRSGNGQASPVSIRAMLRFAEEYAGP